MVIATNVFNKLKQHNCILMSLICDSSKGCVLGEGFSIQKHSVLFLIEFVKFIIVNIIHKPLDDFLLLYFVNVAADLTHPVVFGYLLVYNLDAGHMSVGCVVFKNFVNVFLHIMRLLFNSSQD